MAVLVGKKAPDFTATAVLGNNEITNITLSEAIKGKYAVVFFYPLDFTFVCPSELIAFDHRLEEHAGERRRHRSGAVHPGCRHQARDLQGL